MWGHFWFASLWQVSQILNVKLCFSLSCVSDCSFCRPHVNGL